MKGPQFLRFFNPLIEALKELGGSGRPVEACNTIAKNLKISDEERSVLIKSGISRIDNQIHWSRMYLVKLGYIDSSKRGVWKLTEKGDKTKPFSEEKIYELFSQVQGKFQKQKKDSSVKENDNNDEDLEIKEITPEEADDPSISGYKEKLIETLKNLSPQGFEKLCQLILRSSGFEEVKVTGRTGDGGIDGHGVLRVNDFVSFSVIFQCKKYSNSVGSPELRNFRGAMAGRTDKGIFLTTGTFTQEAKREAVRDGVPPIELVDGAALINILEKLELGVIPETKIVYHIDEKFFKNYQN
jgi:restriction system protein